MITHIGEDTCAWLMITHIGKDTCAWLMITHIGEDTCAWLMMYSYWLRYLCMVDDVLILVKILVHG